MSESIFTLVCQNGFDPLVSGASVPLQLEHKFVLDMERIKHLYLPHFVDTVAQDNGCSETSTESARKALTMLLKAYPVFESECPEASLFFRYNVQNFFYYRSASTAGGSSDSLPGVIWACPRKNWGIADVVEFFVHESVHQLLFLDEAAYQHYSEETLLNSEKILCYSAVRRIARPLPLVFHSLCVGIEVLRSRQASQFLRGVNDFVFHPNTSKLLDSCNQSLGEISEHHRQHFSVRGMEILDSVSSTLSALKVAHSKGESI